MKLKSFMLLGCLGILMLSGIVVAQAPVGEQESAKNTWAKLARRFANRPEFAFVENNPALPNVLIYGDSISIGYTQRVRAKIEGQANVYRLYHNGGNSRSFIPMMTKMHNTMRDEQLDKPWTFQWDVIHFNVGLHDLTVRTQDKENGTHVSTTPIDVYKKNIGDIVTYLQQLAPNAKLIFATTTPVPEGTFGPTRIAGDAQRYNAAAFEVLRKTPDIAVNDLFSFTKPNHPEWWSEPGNVHYNETGKNAQGDEVARVILNAIRTLSPSASVGAQESAENAWANLAGRFANRPEFAFVENNPALPNVLIYGDSISIGYTQRVRAKIEGQANVYRLYHNGGNSRSFIPMMTKMHNTMRDEQLDKPWTFQWDVIHFNVGLHDLTVRTQDKENGTHVSTTPIDVYKKNIGDIVTYLQQLAPNAKLIFATTTPVPEGTFGPTRIAGDAQRYNAAAFEVLRKTPDIAVNDLFSFTKPNHPEWWSEPGNVHYNETGKNAQGDEVARVILNAIRTLSPSASVGAQESAENAWANLAGRFANRPEFAFVENNPDLPNVLIYGDSISIGYTQRVRAKIEGQANVYRLFRNGGSSQGFVQLMENMHDVMCDEQLEEPWDFQWDVIHFNVGLHDLKYLLDGKLDKENGVQVTSLEDYKKNLRDIVAYLKKLAPNAKLIFATTTPVPDGAQGRFVGDAKKYNEAALEVLRDFPEIVINDLFTFTKPWSKPGDVHFNVAGRNAQGDEVARVILSGFKITPANDSQSDRSQLDDRSLLNSDGSRFVPKDFYPGFSWETTPRYFMFGDKNRVLRPEQVRFIAEQTDFLCIEKSHGMGELGAAELGAKHEATAFKKIKPDMKVLFYFNAAFAWPYTSYNENFTSQRIDAHPELMKFLITNPKTGELIKRFGVAFCYDVLNPDFRDWWVKTVAKGVKDAGCDGAFIDQMHGNIMYRNRDMGPEVEEAMGQMMAALKHALGPDKILLANNAYNDDAKFVYPVSDAIMFENYARVKSNKESLLAEWGHMLRNARDGKISVFRLGVEGTWRGHMKPNMPELSQEKLEFALACYLIGAQPYSYFLYSWGWKLGTGALVDYPELRKPLGPPKGAYQRTTPDGWEFTREFEHASVWVNTETRQAKISWR